MILILAPGGELIAGFHAMRTKYKMREDQYFEEGVSSLQNELNIYKKLCAEQKQRINYIEKQLMQPDIDKRSLEIQVAALNQRCEQAKSQIRKEESLRKELESQCNLLDEKVVQVEKLQSETEQKLVLAERKLLLAEEEYKKELDKLRIQSKEIEDGLQKEYQEYKEMVRSTVLPLF